MVKNLITILFIIFPLTSAGELVKYKEDKDSATYLLTDSLEFTSNDSVVLWTLVDFEQSDKDFRSMTTLFEFKCSPPKQYKILRMEFYNKNMAEGDKLHTEDSSNPNSELYNTPWEHPPASSNTYYMISDVCDVINSM